MCYRGLSWICRAGPGLPVRETSGSMQCYWALVSLSLPTLAPVMMRWNISLSDHPQHWSWGQEAEGGERMDPTHSQMD